MLQHKIQTAQKLSQLKLKSNPFTNVIMLVWLKSIDVNK